MSPLSSREKETYHKGWRQLLHGGDKRGLSFFSLQAHLLTARLKGTLSSNSSAWQPPEEQVTLQTMDRKKGVHEKGSCKHPWLHGGWALQSPAGKQTWLESADRPTVEPPPPAPPSSSNTSFLSQMLPGSHCFSNYL